MKDMWTLQRRSRCLYSKCEFLKYSQLIKSSVNLFFHAKFFRNEICTQFSSSYALLTLKCEMEKQNQECNRMFIFEYFVFCYKKWLR